MKFCTKTKGLSGEQKKEFAKDLKKFTKQEAEKFRNQEPKNSDQSEDESP